jgi:cell filamentation protein, protein adenylyltransferase
MTGDPYVYPGTDTLRNKESIRDPEELARLERQAAANRMETLPDNISISVEGYREIHRYIFQDVYDWAGQDRTVDIAKNNSLFCLAPYIDQELEKRFTAIQRENNLCGLSADQFAERAAEHISELNAIHPFREGNGRVQRAFLEILGRQADHEIDLTRIDPAAWNEASIEAFRTVNCSKMREIIAAALLHGRYEGRDE